MKLRALYLFIFLLPIISKAQETAFPKKIKVILLGTFHFGSTSDKNRTSFPDLFSEKRQQELDEMVNKLAKVNPAKIFIEASKSYQQTSDSNYNLYSKEQLKDSSDLRNEIAQIGYRLAKKATLNPPLCVDYKQEIRYDLINQFEKGIGADSTLQYPKFFDIAYPFIDTTKRISLKKMDLSTYYKGLNDEYHRKQNEFDYLHYALNYGYKEDYSGAEFTASWYSRNLKIFTNILRELEPKDDCIVIIFGSGHTAILRQFFENHPSFEIIDLEKVL